VLLVLARESTGKPLGTSGLSLAKRGPRVDYGPVRWQENPLYRPTSGREFRGRALLLWRIFLTAILGLYLLLGHYVYAAIFVAVWVVAEPLRLPLGAQRATLPSTGR
jgi:hypothetical protein